MPSAAISHAPAIEIERDDLPARRAEALQGGDGGALAIDEAAHRIGHADAADQQRGQADQGQELGEALDVALAKRGSALTRVRISKPASGKRVLGLRRDLRQAVVGRHAPAAAMQPVGPAHQAARLDEAGGRAGASCDIRRRGPKPMPPAILSGSETRLARNCDASRRRA